MFNGERLKILRKEKKLTQAQLGKILNISDAAINRYEKGLRQPDTITLNKIAEFFDVSVDYLLNRTVLEKNDLPEGLYKIDNFIKVPVLGEIRAGEPILASQNIIGFEYVAENVQNYGECFFLRVTGDSMNLSRISDGDLVLVRRQDTVENGDIAVVLVDRENATIKRFYKAGSIVTLMPHSTNPEHQPIIIDCRKTNLKIIGKVIQAVIKF